jgi:SAM-dependent methyltransferase
MRSSFALAPSRGSAERRRRISFFFHDYLDPVSRFLEVGPPEGALEPYLKEAGFHRYTRLDREPPADLVGELRSWRELGLEPEGFDVVLAFDLPAWADGARACLDLLTPGGLLFATAPVPGRVALARALAALGLAPPPSRRPPRGPGDLAHLPGFLPLAVRRRAFVEQWARLRKPLAP